MNQKNFFYRNGLSLVFLLFFMVCIFGQAQTGWREHNRFLSQYGIGPTGFGEYLLSGHFIQATFENWESEFLQMGLFVVLTIYLRQQGSSESRSFDKDEKANELIPGKDSPRAVKKGGFHLWFYQFSLSAVLFSFFIFSFLMHWYGSWIDECEKKMLEHEPVPDFIGYLGHSRFWFESFQNWQSEFLSIFALIFLSVYLRQKGSPQSKNVNAPHFKTGHE
jgi:hypothetical protein